MIKGLAVCLAGPFGKGIKITNKRVGHGASAGQYHLITINFPHEMIAGLQTQSQPPRTRDGELYFRSDFSGDHIP
ncbi:MAG: hypothetical protein ABL912_03660 [Novosphingobium sp.]